MEFIDVINNYNRMCNSFGFCGSSCPLYNKRLNKDFCCTDYMTENPKEIEEIVSEWSEKIQL